MRNIIIEVFDIKSAKDLERTINSYENQHQCELISMSPADPSNFRHIVCAFRPIANQLQTN